MTRTLPLCAALAAFAMTPNAAQAQGSAAERPPRAKPAAPIYETQVTTPPAPVPELPAERARSTITREQLDKRLPRSAPDALRFEPGVFVQQTAHGQGSAFIRGLTGQQTLLLFDGIRLNNSTYRQGPNQYFFTLDSQTLQSLQVQRGGASTRWGSDALGGVILARPIEPLLRPAGLADPITLTPHLRGRGATADEELGGRAQLNFTAGDRVAFFGGVGRRRVGQLMASGTITGLDGEAPRVPRFDDDGRTQLGTGFDELTADGRLLYQISATQAVKLAAYVYRQGDSPRTDQCPAAFAPWNECLNYDEQYRTLVYGVWEATPGWAGLAGARATLSWQQQHERRTLSRPSAFVESLGRDTVDTLGLTWVGETRAWALAPWLSLKLEYGADTYQDFVQSAAWIRFADIDVTQERSRGQYLDGSGYTYGGAFARARARLLDTLRLSAGARLSWIVAAAPADPSSGSAAIDRFWLPVAGHGGVEWRVAPWLHLLANVDHSFRAPNLDDLTSRQQTGPGFQFENPSLAAETATTLEIGARTRGWLRAEVWGFATLLEGAVIKRPRDTADCPPDTPACRTAWTRLQLVNADAPSVIVGAEASLLATLPAGLVGRATLAWAWGEGPNVGDPPADPDLDFLERVPLSRIPPLNGTVELLWRHASGLAVGAALRWAADQDRLAIADVADERIPAGGTPGFAVIDLRLSYRWGERLLVSATLENLLDTPYRYHGSSVNGPGRGMMVLLDVGPVWRD